MAAAEFGGLIGVRGFCFQFIGAGATCVIGSLQQTALRIRRNNKRAPRPTLRVLAVPVQALTTNSYNQVENFAPPRYLADGSN
ncbi:MAG TPA: hypothetical protein VN924_04635 [Bryobacteraceae bacterium]|jgi:hypothetical protein|nr:hypothetical protein [Bryobacteraceae bacterium]